MNKSEKYQKIVTIAQQLLTKTNHRISNLANLSALIQEEFLHLWVGFYMVDERKNELYLGPFQGPLACTNIQYGKGVCGSSWKQKKTLIVADVNQFEGHIACSSLSVSEIVVPVFGRNEEIIAVLDIDSITAGNFDETDKKYLEQLVSLL